MQFILVVVGTLIGLLLSYNQLIRTRWLTRVNI
nr:MAG TPA: putative membrane protein [Caudoviricetes sp.]